MMIKQTAIALTPNAEPNNVREYHVGRSKQITNVNKYTINGIIHRKGITTISRHKAFVVASKNREVVAGRNSHKIRVLVVTGSNDSFDFDFPEG